MYDPRENRIIIDGEDKTDSVERCCYTSRPNRCHVIFCNFPKTYSYVPSKVLWLKDPVVFDPQHCHLLHKGRRIEPLSYIAAFQQGSRRFWYVEYANGTGAHYKGSEVELVRSCLEEPPAQDRFAYLREVAELNPLKTDDGQKLLLMQYQKIDFVSDCSAAALYLNPGKDSPRQFPVPQLIYPFGCNASQQRAIQAAFGNQISIIQGPPGTGKTLLARAMPRMPGRRAAGVVRRRAVRAFDVHLLLYFSGAGAGRSGPPEVEGPRMRGDSGPGEVRPGLCGLRPPVCRSA